MYPARFLLLQFFLQRRGRGGCSFARSVYVKGGRTWNWGSHQLGVIYPNSSTHSANGFYPQPPSLPLATHICIAMGWGLSLPGQRLTYLARSRLLSFSSIQLDPPPAPRCG